jgi:hypothetical protein
MESLQLPGGRTGLVSQDLPNAKALAAISVLAVAFGIHIFIWVDNARVNDNSILGVVPWLLYPGIVAAIAVRSRVELLAIGVAAILPVAAFGLFGLERLQSMGIGVALGYATLIWISAMAASLVADRRGAGGAIAAVFVGAATFVLALGSVLFVPQFLFPAHT